MNFEDIKPPMDSERLMITQGIISEEEQNLQNTQMMLPIIEYTSLILLIIMLMITVINRQKKGRLNAIMITICVILAMILIGSICFKFFINI